MKIVARQASCVAFGTGYCWITDNPYYTGHYKTKREALAAARKVKPERDRRARTRSNPSPVLEDEGGV